MDKPVFRVEKTPHDGWVGWLPLKPMEITLDVVGEGGPIKAYIIVRYSEEDAERMKRLLAAMDKVGQRPEPMWYMKNADWKINFPPLLIMFFLRDARESALESCLTEAERLELKRKARHRAVSLVTSAEREFRLLDIQSNAAALRFLDNLRRRGQYFLRIAVPSRGGDEVIWEEEMEKGT